MRHSCGHSAGGGHHHRPVHPESGGHGKHGQRHCQRERQQRAGHPIGGQHQRTQRGESVRRTPGQCGTDRPGTRRHPQRHRACQDRAEGEGHLHRIGHIRRRHACHVAEHPKGFARLQEGGQVHRGIRRHLHAGGILSLLCSRLRHRQSAGSHRVDRHEQQRHLLQGSA